MNWDGLSLVDKSLALALWAHQVQYRDSSHPYSTHFLEIALELAEKYEMDPVTISAALLHDTIEDKEIEDETITGPNSQKPMLEIPVEMENIVSEAVSPEVGGTVTALTKARARYLRQEIGEDEMSRLKIIMSLLDNPRVAIIKVFDRLHNMRTLYARPRGKRIKTINETQQIYIPLAKRLGLFDEADELDEFCLRMLDKESDSLATDIEETRLEFYSQLSYETIIAELTQIADDTSCAFKFRLPGIHDIFRRMGEIRDTKLEDFYLNVDLVMNEQAHNDDPLLQWGRDATRLASDFT